MSVAATACGHSESEWKAQLAKYNAEVEKNRAAGQRISDLMHELELAVNRTNELSAQLESMGMDMSELNSTLQARGEALSKLNSDMDSMRKALAEYKTRAAALDRIKKQLLALREKLDSLTKLGLNVSIRKNRMIISLPGDILFDSGKTDLRKEGENVLREVARVITSDSTLLSRDFQVAGHTDNTPLQRGPYIDNWGLSLMRARTVLVYLITPTNNPTSKGGPGGGLPSKNWSASGYGETDPVVSNSTAVNKQKNRRVELVVMPNVEEMLDLKSLTDAS